MGNSEVQNRNNRLVIE